MNAPVFSKINFSSLKISLTGGAALQQATAERWAAATGSKITEAYGLIETAPAVCINPLDLDTYNGCIDLPIPSTEVSIQNGQDIEVAANNPGELWVRGPQVMRGYWRQPKETAEVLSADGWLRTGDINETLANGYIRLLDRKKDMILVSGFSVFQNEIEDAIAAQPDIHEVGVIGVPDEETGEAVIVKAEPSLSEDQVRDHCRTVFTRYKQPMHIRFAAQLPKNNIDKILRRELRQRYN